MENLGPLLAQHPFLTGMDPDQVKLLVGCASNTRFDAGKYIFRESEEANQFYIIRSGKVALEIYTPDRGSIIVSTLGEGDILGWSWLIPPYNWRFDARVIEETRAIALDGKCLRTKCEGDHNLGYELLKRFASILEQRLEATRIQLLDIYDAKG
jgi:CRP/FNR family transcriptional regulator, cyclic AMP receptor protein